MTWFLPLLTAVGGLGLGAVVGALIASRASGRKDNWETLRWADDNLSSADEATVERNLNHLIELREDASLSASQRAFARTSVDSYLEATGQPPTQG